MVPFSCWNTVILFPATTSPEQPILTGGETVVVVLYKIQFALSDSSLDLGHREKYITANCMNYLKTSFFNVLFCSAECGQIYLEWDRKNIKNGGVFPPDVGRMFKYMVRMIIMDTKINQ